jgi:hypothetical protein
MQCIALSIGLLMLLLLLLLLLHIDGIVDGDPLKRGYC